MHAAIFGHFSFPKLLQLKGLGYMSAVVCRKKNICCNVLIQLPQGTKKKLGVEMVFGKSDFLEGHKYYVGESVSSQATEWSYARNSTVTWECYLTQNPPKVRNNEH
jgi:hypothetical protein